MRVAAAALALALLLPTTAGAAEDLKVTAAFDVLESRPDDVALYVITISGEDIPRLRQNPSPDFSDFQVVSGPSRGSSTQINMVNGQARMSQSLKLTWQLMPKGGREGEFRVPTFGLVLGGQALRVPPAGLKSSLQAAPRRGSRRGRSSVFDSPSASRSDRGSEGGRLEMTQQLSSRDVYLGEEVILTHVLEFGREISVRRFDPGAIEFAGFEKQERKIEHKPRPVSGKTWQEVPLARWRLVPLTLGEARLQPREYGLTLQSRSRDPFQDFFGGNEQQIRRSTSETSIRVKPLPPGAPPEFAGAVGTFQVESTLGTESLDQGDGTTLTIVVRGTGNFSAVKPPQLRLPPGVRAFDPEVRDDTRTARDGHTAGAKIYEYPLLIEEAGSHDFEALGWAYLDPKSGRYVTRTTRPMRLVAAPSAAPGSLGLAGGSRTSLVEALETDIEHVTSEWTPTPPVERELSPVGLPAWFWPALLAGPLLPLAAAVRRFARSRSSGDARSERSKQAGREARRRLAEAHAAAKAGRGLEAADAAAAAVSRFVVERCGVGGAEPVAAEVVELVKGQAGPELAARVQAHLADCDFLRFAGAAAGAADARARANEAGELLDELERALSHGAGESS